MNKKGVTLVEILLAITILAMALVPMAASLTSYFKRARTIEASTEYMHRAQNLLNDLLTEVSFRETARVYEAAGGSGVNSDTTDNRVPVFVNMTDIKKRKYYQNSGTNDPTTRLCPPLSMYDGSAKDDPTPDGYWLPGDNNGVSFWLGGVKYNFSLEIKNIPLQFHWKQYELDDTCSQIVGSELYTCSGPAAANANIADIYTINRDGDKRDMFQQITLFIDWKEYGRDLHYSFVTFKANLDDANDAFDVDSGGGP